MTKEPNPYEESFRQLTRRYRGVSPEALTAVMCPLLVPLRTLDKQITKLPGQSHYRASFTVELNDENRSVIQRGRTGKFVPGHFQSGGAWTEIAKGRIVDVDTAGNIASGEIYVGSSRGDLKAALDLLSSNDLLEIDQYGASAKVLSALAEYYLVQKYVSAGFEVYRMPEDMARHLGAYRNYDFNFQRGGESRRVEVKSLWGTNTRFARLIHSTTTRPKGDPATWSADQINTYYPTSTCRFTTQDIFAVSLFLRTGNIQDFAFARSIPIDIKPYGLLRSTSYPEHVHQNPICEIGNGSWYATIEEVWNLA